MKIPRRRILAGHELLDAADEGRARHAAAHLAGIIPRDRPQGTAAVRRQRPKMGSRAASTYDRCRIREGPT